MLWKCLGCEMSSGKGAVVVEVDAAFGCVSSAHPNRLTGSNQSWASGVLKVSSPSTSERCEPVFIRLGLRPRVDALCFSIGLGVDDCLDWEVFDDCDEWGLLFIGSVCLFEATTRFLASHRL